VKAIKISAFPLLGKNYLNEQLSTMDSYGEIISKRAYSKLDFKNISIDKQT
jgi:hypothetical protein